MTRCSWQLCALVALWAVGLKCAALSFGNSNADVSERHKRTIQECLQKFQCPEIYSPVCASTAETFANNCQMQLEACVRREHIEKRHDGACKDSSPEPPVNKNRSSDGMEQVPEGQNRPTTPTPTSTISWYEITASEDTFYEGGDDSIPPAIPKNHPRVGGRPDYEAYGIEPLKDIPEDLRQKYIYQRSFPYYFENLRAKMEAYEEFPEEYKYGDDYVDYDIGERSGEQQHQKQPANETATPRDATASSQDAPSPHKDKPVNPQDGHSPPQDAPAPHQDALSPPRVGSTRPKDASAPHNDAPAPPEDAPARPQDAPTPHQDASAPPKDAPAPHNDEPAPPEDARARPKDAPAPPQDAPASSQDADAAHQDADALPQNESAADQNRPAPPHEAPAGTTTTAPTTTTISWYEITASEDSFYEGGDDSIPPAIPKNHPRVGGHPDYEAYGIKPLKDIPEKRRQKFIYQRSFPYYFENLREKLEWAKDAGYDSYADYAAANADDYYDSYWSRRR